MKALWQKFWSWITGKAKEKVNDVVKPEPKPDEQVPPDEASNGFTLDKVTWLGPNGSKGWANVTAKLHSAAIAGSLVKTKFDKYDWPRNADGGCDAMICFFRKEGDKWIGGKFDWFRVGGQPSKTMENIFDGYNGHKVPASGTPVAFMLMSVDQKQRSNAAFTKWP